MTIQETIDNLTQNEGWLIDTIKLIDETEVIVNDFETAVISRKYQFNLSHKMGVMVLIFKAGVTKNQLIERYEKHIHPSMRIKHILEDAEANSNTAKQDSQKA